MKLIRQLFGKKSPVVDQSQDKRTKAKDKGARSAADIAEQLSAVKAHPQSTLEALVGGTEGDPQNIAVRVAALKQLPYATVIWNKVLTGPAALEKAAVQHLASLVDSEQVAAAQLIQDIKQTEKLLAIAGHCKNRDLQNLVLGAVNSEEELAHLCANANSAIVRKTIAERIEKTELLRELLKTLKHKDKNAYRIIKSKLDARKAEEDARSELAALAGEVCEEIEQHSKRAHEKDYEARLERFNRHWREVVEHAPEAEIRRYTNALALCEGVLSQYNEAMLKKAKQSETQPEKAEELEIAVNADEDLTQCLGRLWKCLNELYNLQDNDARFISDVLKNVEAVKTQWLDFASTAKVSETLNKQHLILTRALDKVFADYPERGSLMACRNRLFREEGCEQEREKDIRYLRDVLNPVKTLGEYMPAQFELGECVVQAQAILKKISENKKLQQQQRQSLERVMSGLIRKGNAAVDQGHLKQALGIRHSVEEKLVEFGALPTHLATQFERLDEGTQKLIDWQAYAVVPKKEALVRSMEALVGMAIPADALATKIKNLQDEWKELNQSGKDRQEGLWQQFSDAADKAYEPCKVYFQALAETRQGNLEKRRTLVKQLQDYCSDNDWENADWAQVEKVLRAARPEFHSYSPVERTSNKPLLAAFEQAMTNIQEKLESEFSKNMAAKEQIIQQAVKLNEIADVNQAIDTAKRLQAQWKKAGRCAYKDNEKLWKRFRAQCDGVFTRKDSVEKERKQVLSQQLDIANGLVKKLEDLLALSGDDFLTARAEKDAIVKEFGSVGELPHQAATSLQKTFAKLLDIFGDQTKKQLQNIEAQSWLKLFEINEEINTYANVKANIDSDETLLKANLGEITSSIDSVAKWQEGSLSVIKGKLDEVSSQEVGQVVIHSQRAANKTGTKNELESSGGQKGVLESLRLLCVRAEILAGKESPSEDKDLRMSYQVGLLQKGLGGAKAVMNANSALSLALEWVAVEPVENSIYSALFSRFHLSWKTL
ncbi:MAG: exonuclease SbcC [Lentisphaeria bacterium]|jgi:exonuclease SbcC